MEFLKTIFSQGWISSLIGIIGIIIGLLFYRASRIGPRLVYQLRASRLIGLKEQELPKEAEIVFKGKSVLRLTKAHIVFWNAGKATLDGEKIVTGDPLRLEFNEGTEVVKVRIPKRTRKANNFTARVDPDSANKVICGFDYLDPGDGAVIELLHTDEERHPKIQGSIRGLLKGVSNRAVVSLSSEHEELIILIAGIFLIVFAIIEPFLEPLIKSPPDFFRSLMLFLEKPLTRYKTVSPPPFPPFFALVAMFLVGVGMVFYSLLLILRARRQLPKSLMIEDFER